MATSNSSIFEGEDLSTDLYFDLASRPNHLAKLEEMYSEAGIEQVKTAPRLSNDFLFEKMTLISFPKFEDIMPDRNHTLENYLHGKYSFQVPSGSTIALQLKCLDMEYIARRSIFHNEEIVKFKIEDHTVALFFPERNAILLAFHPFAIKFPAQVTLHNFQNDNRWVLHQDIINSFGDTQFEAKDIQEIIRTRMIAYFTQALNERIDSKQSRIRDLKLSIEEYENSLYNKIKDLQYSLSELHALEENKDVDYDTIIQKIDEVKKLKFVKEVNVTPQGFEVSFGKINITRSRKKYYIGDFKMVVSGQKLRIYNSNNQANTSYHHPHIDEGGKPCLDEASPVVTKLLAEMDFKRLAFQIYSFLQTYNPDSPYKKLKYWDPEYSDDED